MERVKERETVLDVVCGAGVSPPEAIASRAYKGEAYYFCCPGCAEAFDRDPAAYVREEVIRGYRVEGKVKMPPDPERVRMAEAEAGRYGPDIRAAEERAQRARNKVERLRRELQEARARLAQRRDEVQRIEKREEELRAMPEREEELRAMPERERVADLEREAVRERNELEAAERALAEGRRKEEAFLLRQRAEAGDLAERERMLQAEIRAENERAQSLQQRIDELERARGEYEDARAGLAERRVEVQSISRREAELGGGPAEQPVEEPEPQSKQDRSAPEQAERALAEAGRREEELRGTPEAQRAADLEERLRQARSDFERAARELAEARMRVEAIKATRPADIADLEQRRQSMEAEIRALESRVRDLESRIKQLDSLRREYENVRDSLARHRDELQGLGKRDEEIRAALASEEERFKDLERQVARERSELEAAQQALAEARVRAEEMLRRRRDEIAGLERQKAAAGDLRAEERRAEELEARIGRLQGQVRDAEHRITELRDEEKRAQDELDRIRHETREVVLEGLPAMAGEEPIESYRARYVQKKPRR